MSFHSPELTGITIGNNSFGPADFPDASEISLENYSLSEDSSYMTAVNNAVLKHYGEIKDKQDSAIQLQKTWKKKYNEFLYTKNNKILEFLTCKLKRHPVIGKAEDFFQKFGKKNINFNQQSIRDIVLDLSGENVLDEINTLCISNNLLSLEKYTEQTRFILDNYKKVVDKILEKEQMLQHKLESLDTIKKKIHGVSSLSHNEHYEELMEISTKYIGKIFDDNTIEDDYNEMMDNYRKFIYYRDMLKTIRTLDLAEKEPLCSICFQDSISYAFVPCGHTFCANCIKKQAVNCSVCRGQIRERVRLYFT